MNFVFRESFEFMRFDFLVDKDLKAWVIEVSYNVILPHFLAEISFMATFLNLSMHLPTPQLTVMDLMFCDYDTGKSAGYRVLHPVYEHGHFHT